jgi:hypothetical protein
MSRVIPNKLVKTRAEIEGKAYRMISFYHSTPGAIPEDQWSVFDYENSKFIVDKLTLATMAECQCEFMTRETDSESKEPPIVSVKLDIIDETPNKK